MDDKNEALAIWKNYYGDADGLAAYLTQICLSKLGVVYEVFALLNDFYDYDVGCRFLKKVDRATLDKLLQTNEGIVFCRQLYSMLNAGLSDFLTKKDCSTDSSELFLFNAKVNAAKVKPNDAPQPRKLTEAEINYYTQLGDSQKLYRVSKDKKTKQEIWNPLPESKRQRFDPNVCWDLPTSGAGFVVYNIDDLNDKASYRDKLGDEYGYDQIGTKETIEAMMNIARIWIANPKHTRDLEYGDVSRPGGINTPDHSTHKTGKAFDVRLQRKDNSSSGGFSYTQSGIYSPELTKEFILLVVQLYPGTTFLFNDPNLEKLDNDTKNIVAYSSGHNDHLHVMFPRGEKQ